MSNPIMLYLDSIPYNVFVEYPTLKRKFSILEGSNSGKSILGKKIRDILGTNYEYTMTIRADPSHYTDYDSLFEQLRNPVETHTISVPYGQGELVLTGYIESGEDVYQGYYKDHKCWDTLSLTIKSISPITTVTPVTPGYNTWTIGGYY